MSAICAAYRWDGQPVPASIPERLLGALSEYGATGSYWAPATAAQPVALGCIPWHVTTEDTRYHGPVRGRDDAVVVVADARLDNRAELAARLALSPRDGQALSDSELVLLAWQKWQQQCAQELIGDFAFAIWDAQARELFCARDAMGQRVLFYHESAHGVELATTAHALTALPHVSAALDEQKVADFLVLLQRPESSFFRGIHRLPPGHTLTARPTGLRVQRYWSPVPERTLRLGSDQAYVDAFVEVFGTAVRAQLRSAGPIGMMASGGLDSSAVAAVAAAELRERGERLLTFHAAPREGYAGPARRGMVVDESRDVQRLHCLHPNIDLIIQRAHERSPFTDLETMFRMTGAPPRNPSNVPWFLSIYNRAAATGTRVMLSGHKGNATVSQTGLRSLRDSAVRGEWRRLWRETQALARATGQGRRDIFRREVVQPLLPATIAAVLRRFRGRPPVRVLDATLSAINPDFARAMNLEERIRDANRHHEDLDRLPELKFRLTVLAGGADVYDMYSGLRPWFGIETRDPTADRRVVEFCMAVPGSQYLHEGVTRSLIRRAMAGRVPDEIRLRSSYGMQSADWPEWLPSLRAEISQELQRLEVSETARRCLDLPKLRRLTENWPERMTLAHEKDYPLLLLRGITMGRFIRWFEDTYT